MRNGFFFQWDNNISSKNEHVMSLPLASNTEFPQLYSHKWLWLMLFIYGRTDG